MVSGDTRYLSERNEETRGAVCLKEVGEWRDSVAQFRSLGDINNKK